MFLHSSDDEYSISNGTNNDVDVYSMSNGTISDISMVPSVEETGEDSNEVRDGSSLQDGLGVPGEVLKENRNRFDRFDEIADIIINAFTIRKRERFINSEQGILSNEESEVRLIILGSVLGLILNVTLSAMLVLASIVFSNKFAVTTFTPSLEKSNSYPTPYLLIMSKLGLGDIVVLRQDKELNFEIDFNFKVPANKAHFSPHYFLWTSWPGYHGRAIETGYSVFEDRGDLFIAYSDTSKRMIVLNPSNKHKTLINSQLPTNHFYSNSIVRTGDFVWIFGGYSVPTSDPKSFNHSEFQNHGCSSVKYGAEEDTFTGSAMWHMDKQVWFEGPSLPIKTCSLESTAISLNKTDVLIFIGPFIGSYLKHVEGEEWINEKGGCIQALHFSYKTFSWVSQDDCFIDFGPRHYNYNGHIQNIKHFYNTSNILSLVSTSVLDKDGNL